MFSDDHIETADDYNVSIGNVKKLVPNFFDKKKYVFHCKSVQLCLRLGLKIKKVHRVSDFDQSKWLKLYIKFNTQRKNRSKKNGDKNEKAFYKLMNNGVHSKAMENGKRLFEMDINTKLHNTNNI